MKLLLILALLICNAARGLASRLARGLALAATAVLYGLCNILGFNGLNSHDKNLRFSIDDKQAHTPVHTRFIITQSQNNVNRISKIFSQKQEKIRRNEKRMLLL
jgi:hypothetical protein